MVATITPWFGFARRFGTLGVCAMSGRKPFSWSVVDYLYTLLSVPSVSACPSLSCVTFVVLKRKKGYRISVIKLVHGVILWRGVEEVFFLVSQPSPPTSVRHASSANAGCSHVLRKCKPTRPMKSKSSERMAHSLDGALHFKVIAVRWQHLVCIGIRGLLEEKG